jgi:hypothetical protein
MKSTFLNFSDLLTWIYVRQLLNERIIELIDTAPKSFAAPDTHLEMIKKILSYKN